jgi:hypothetical protein
MNRWRHRFQTLRRRLTLSYILVTVVTILTLEATLLTVVYLVFASHPVTPAPWFEPCNRQPPKSRPTLDAAR